MQHAEHEHETTTSTPVPLVALAWLAVGLPLSYGLWQTVIKAFQLLGG